MTVFDTARFIKTDFIVPAANGGNVYGTGLASLFATVYSYEK